MGGRRLMVVTNFISSKEYEDACDTCMQINVPFCALCSIKETCIILKIRRKERVVQSVD